jgi:hypothetical protein
VAQRVANVPDADPFDVRMSGLQVVGNGATRLGYDLQASLDNVPGTPIRRELDEVDPVNGFLDSCDRGNYVLHSDVEIARHQKTRVAWPSMSARSRG